MAGRRIEQFVMQQIREQGGWAVLLTRIASGESIAAISRTLFRPDKIAIDRSTLSHMLHRDPERSKLVDLAQEESGSAHAEGSLLVIQDAPLDKDAIQKAKILADAKLRYAGLVDRKRWGESKQQVNVQVNVEGMHLDALRHRTLPVSQPKQLGLASETGPEHGVGARDTVESAA